MEWVGKYIQEIIEKKEGKKVIIYGAGKAAKIILNLCQGNDIEIESFCVTNLNQNESMIKNIPVQQINTLKLNPDDVLFLIGVRERGKQKIKEILEDEGYFNYIKTPENIFEYEEWEFNRKRRPALEITPKIGCCVSCKYCPQNLLLNEYFRENKVRKSQLDFKEYKYILDKLPRNTLIEWAGFVEPFLNEAAADMMLYTQEMGFEQTLFTTLVGMKEEDFEKIRNIPFKIVCLHTPDKYGYAKISLTPDYLKMFEKVVQAKNALGDSFVTTANCQSIPHPAILPLTTGKLKIYTELSDRAGILDSEESQEIAHFNKTGPIWCDRAEALNHNVLLPDGTVVLCCNDFGLRHVLGNLLTDNYEEIMKSKVMRKVKCALRTDNHIPVICRKCIYAKELLHENEI